MLPIVVVTSAEACELAIAMCLRGEARGVLYAEDAPNGNVIVRSYAVHGPDGEATLAELDAIVRRASEAQGSIVVEPLQVGKRGAA